MTDKEVINESQSLSLNFDGSIVFASIVTLILAILVFCIVKYAVSNNSCDTPTEKTCNSCKKLQNKDLFYLCIIMGICLIVVFTFVFYSNQDAINLFSFASTLSSIILSVIAIFMSISGEKTQELHRNQIELTANSLENTRLKLDKNIESLNTKLDILDANLKRALENTDTLVKATKPIQSDDSTNAEGSYEDNDFSD